MEERLVEIVAGKYPKKYTAIVSNKCTGRTRRVHFGDQRYEQYKDRTKLALYAKQNHSNRRRMRNYYSRHSGVRTRKEGLEKEWRRAKKSGRYTAKLLSHVYLW